MSTAEVITKKPNTEKSKEEVHDSEEYESAEEIEGEYDEEVEEEEVEIEIEEEVEDDEDEEKESASKELDDDEDRKNPQFIPKHGYFYEHDDRTRADDGPEEPEAETKEVVKKEPATMNDVKEKKVVAGRWSHDMFEEEEQGPKSKEELSTIYGYDIRGEEQAPRARRRKKYGRGPNTYTRKWEDEEAYQKPRGGFRGGRGRGGFRGARRGSGEPGREYDNEFPEMDNKGRNDERRERPSRNDDSNYPSRGGPGGPRGRGRRNEFSNRNRYSDRQEPNELIKPSNNNNQHQQQRPPQQSHYQQHQNGRQVRGQEPKEEYQRDRDFPPLPRKEGAKDESPKSKLNKSNRMSSNGSEGNSPAAPSIKDRLGERVPQRPVKLPFSGTEYTGSSGSISTSSNPPPQIQKINKPITPEPKQFKPQPPPVQKVEMDRKIEVEEKKERKEKSPEPLPQRVRPQRNERFANERSERPPTQQIPPRMQRQHQQQQQQQQVENTGSTQASNKPMRFSAQRQRGHMVEGPMILPMNPQVQPPPPAIPAFTGQAYFEGSGANPSPPPAVFTPLSCYSTPGGPTFEAVYEGQSSGGNGPSVSPSMWAHGTYAGPCPGPPYPSPPTGGAAPYADPTAAANLFAQQPAIFAAPPTFIQDATLLNFGPQTTTFPPPFHQQQAYQAYPQVGGVSEVYQGVTYYSTQNQIQRVPMSQNVHKGRQKLQLIEPPDNKGKRGVEGSYYTHGLDDASMAGYIPAEVAIPVIAQQQPSGEVILIPYTPGMESGEQLPEQLASLSLHQQQNMKEIPQQHMTIVTDEKVAEVNKESWSEQMASPQPMEKESWSEQMTTPTETEAPTNILKDFPPPPKPPTPTESEQMGEKGGEQIDFTSSPPTTSPSQEMDDDKDDKYESPLEELEEDSATPPKPPIEIKEEIKEEKEEKKEENPKEEISQSSTEEKKEETPST